MTMQTVNSFEVTDFHLALVSGLSFTWIEGAYDGAPAVDPKRPYGNSDVLTDLALIYAESKGYRLINEDTYRMLFRKADGSLFQPDESFEDWLFKVHREMPIVLQILASNNLVGIAAGVYREVAPYSQRWEAVDSSTV